MNNEDKALIEFIQFMRPDGRSVPVHIERSYEIAEKATKLQLEAGWKFEIEVLMDNNIYMEIFDGAKDEIIASDICLNSHEIGLRVDKLILNAYKIYSKNNLETGAK